MGATEREALKPCPFCGGEATVSESQDGEWIAGCRDEAGCNACPSTLAPTRDAAIAAWNRRAAAAPSGARAVLAATIDKLHELAEEAQGWLNAVAEEAPDER